MQTPHLRIAALTHPGETGKNNEDALFAGGFERDADGTASVLAVVSDGIGGHLAGEVAARLTVETVVARLQSAPGRDPVALLRHAVIESSRAVAREARQTPEYSGMGATVAIGWVIGTKLYIASVGDSRIYLQRGNALLRLTTDHTWVQEAIEHQVISPEEARQHPHAHVLRRHIGGDMEPVPDLRLRLSVEETDEHSTANQGLQLLPLDRILLCSDGLTDLVDDPEIEEILRLTDMQETVTRLVDLARERGGHDNITVVLLEAPRKAGRRGGRSKLALSLLGTLGLLTLVAGAFVLYQLGLWPWP
jgi:serine/threonine protein phosphatase PrpC